jgi:hypothetical protein
VGADSFEHVSERWSREQVLGLAPDAASRKAADGIARPARWAVAGCDEAAVWGECEGSGSKPYRASVELAEPAFRCTCPSRKFPCKHALGLLLLWSEGVVSAAARPGWVGEWLEDRRRRAERREAAPARPRTADPRTAERREQRVSGGIEEFERWLRDQVTEGLSAAESARYSLWDEAARRLVDAQAGALAGQVRALAAIPQQRGPSWPGRLLEEYALLHLLVRAYQRRDELPPDLRETVRSRVGFTTPQEEVLAGPSVRDHWYVAGHRDTEQDRLLTRRTWLRGRRSGRAALILSFAAPGRSLEMTLVPGSTVDADLAFFPGAQPLRALVVSQHASPTSALSPPGTSVSGLLAEYGQALARDPWLDRWPAVLSEVRLGHEGATRLLVDSRGDAVPLDGGDPWRLLALSGGGPVTVCGEWSPRGLRPLSAWHPEEGTAIL